MKTFTLYGLRKPGEEARYIGITSRDLKTRLGAHINRKEWSAHKNNWIAKLKREGVAPEIIPYCVRLTQEEAWELEIALISELRIQGFDLVNSTPGGEGVTMPPEIREKIRVSNTGKKASKETRKKLSESHKGIKKSLETLAKISAASKGHKVSPEARKKISEAATLQWEKWRQEKVLAEMWR